MIDQSKQKTIEIARPAGLVCSGRPVPPKRVLPANARGAVMQRCNQKTDEFHKVHDRIRIRYMVMHVPGHALHM